MTVEEIINESASHRKYIFKVYLVGKDSFQADFVDLSQMEVCRVLNMDPWQLRRALLKEGQENPDNVYSASKGS